MGEFFFFYPKGQIADELAIRGFIAVRGRKPVKTTIRVDELDEDRNLLVVVTYTDESGSLYFPCDNAQDGFFFASTDPLPSSKVHRSLYLELARGQLSRIQRKRADWSYKGFSTPAHLRQKIRRAIRQFSLLVTTDPSEENFDASTVSLFSDLCEIGRKLNERFLNRALVARRKISGWKTRFGFATDLREDWTRAYDALFVGSRANRTKPKLDPVFQTINLHVSWRDVERNGTYDWSRLDAAIRSARKRRLHVTLGPLTRWGADMPTRLQRPTINAEDLGREYEQYLRSALDAVGSRVDRWIVATNVETSPTIPTLEFRLAAALQAVTLIHARFPRSQVFLGFEQALGDAARFGIVPVVYPQDLASRLAAKRVFDGFYLEVNFGLTPRTTAPRDPMELHRFFDRWASFGLKLSMAISCPSAPPFTSPSSVDPDELLSSAFGDKPKRPFFFRSNSAPRLLEEFLWSVQTQQEVARRFYSSALARKAIDELIWSRWSDSKRMSYEEYCDVASVYEGNANDETVGTLFSDVYDEVEAFEDDDFREMPEEDEIFDEIDLLSDDSTISRSESVSFSAEVDLPENYTPTSGIVGVDRRPKATLYKIAALRRAYLDE
ncbi:MAG: hypothetical protein ACOX0A_08780 [Thermoguttaceae bacterium]|jgi:hypothetical protein